MSFESDYLIIIDVLSEDDLQTGRTIEENISDCILEERSTFTCQRIHCNTSQDILDVFMIIEDCLDREGKIPCIHIEGHGSENGLSLPNYSIMKWKPILSGLRKINILTQNNLLFTSGACKSAFIMRAGASIHEAAPVYCLLAPKTQVTAGELVPAFSVFYKTLIRMENLNNADEAFCENTDGQNYAFIFPEETFKKAAATYIKTQCMGKGGRRRLEGLLTKAIHEHDSRISVREMRKKLKEKILGSQSEGLIKLHKIFMMIDICPKNAMRFHFDAVKFEEEVRNGVIVQV